MPVFKQLKRLLYDELKTRMKQRGFKGKLSDGEPEFERRYPWGYALFSIHYIKHYDDFDISVYVHIRHDAIEEIAQRNHPRLSEDICKTMQTMGHDIGYLAGGDPMRWTVSSELDIIPVADAMVAMFDEVGEPFIEKYRHLENAFEVFLDDDYRPKVRIDCGPPSDRANTR